MWISVRGVMMCETTASPSSITPSIISRASSSSRPSRWPSLTIVRISSSIESSSAAAVVRPVTRCSSASSARQPHQRAEQRGPTCSTAARCDKETAPRRSGRSTKAAKPWPTISSNPVATMHDRQNVSQADGRSANERYCHAPNAAADNRERSAAARRASRRPARRVRDGAGCRQSAPGAARRWQISSSSRREKSCSDRAASAARHGRERRRRLAIQNSASSVHRAFSSWLQRRAAQSRTAASIARFGGPHLLVPRNPILSR